MIDQGCQLRRRQAHHPVDDRWPFKGALFQPLPHQHQPAAVPYQNLDPVGAAATEHQHGTAKGILPQRLLDSAASESAPLRKSTGRVAISTRTPGGTGITAPPSPP